MEFIYENGLKYINVNEVAIFLEYKRVQSFVNRIVANSKTIIKDFFIESKELILILFNNKRDKAKSLVEILLTETQQKEIDLIIDEFNEATNNEYEWIKRANSTTMIKNLWYIISSKNYGVLEDIDKYLSLYKITEEDAINLIDDNLSTYVYITNEQRIRLGLE